MYFVCRLFFLKKFSFVIVIFCDFKIMWFGVVFDGVKMWNKLFGDVEYCGGLYVCWCWSIIFFKFFY